MFPPKITFQHARSNKHKAHKVQNYPQSPDLDSLNIPQSKWINNGNIPIPENDCHTKPKDL